jgi:hypothetical protein
MIRFLNPGFAWMLAAPVMIVVLYLLRRRFLPRQVPSVFLWRKSVRDYAANRPFQRLMKNLLLPLQVLAAMALALALMRPALPGGTAGRSIFIFDISGSMQAESDGRSRLEAAKEEALKRIGDLPAEEEITVITAGDEAQRLILNGDREEAEKAIGSIACGRGGADIDRALALASALARSGDGMNEKDRPSVQIMIFSDALRLSDLHTKGGNTPAIINVGKAAENRAVYSLTAENGKAYARTANFGKECTVTLICEADGTLCGASEITIPAGETTGVSFDIPGETQTVSVKIREKDALEADNTAQTSVKQTKELRVAVTTGNHSGTTGGSDSVFLESALKVRPEVTVMRTDTEALASTEADLYILGNDPLILTTQKPETYDPVATAFGVFSWENGDPSTSLGMTESPATEVLESPLTTGITMRNVFFRSWRPISGGRKAVRLGEDPVIVWTEDTVVLGFDLHNTNLPLKYDFPVLIQNILNTLLEQEKTREEKTESLMPLTESDTRDTAPSVEAEKNERTNEQGRELKDVLLLLFLLLLVAEMGVSRYVG